MTQRIEPIETYTVLQDYATSLANNMLSKARAFTGVDHTTTKGTLRELLVSEFLQYFLPDQLAIGSGIIFNQIGCQSKETDIIIYDRRLLPSFLAKQRVGIYPIESVVGVIEVKSGFKQLKKCNNDFRFLHEDLANTEYQFRDKDQLKILTGYIAFNTGKVDPKDFKRLDDTQYKYLDAICVEGNFSVLRYGDKPAWKYAEGAIQHHEEMKRFACWFTDNIRYHCELRWDSVRTKFRSWTSIYFRHQTGIAKHIKMHREGKKTPCSE